MLDQVSDERMKAKINVIATTNQQRGQHPHKPMKIQSLKKQIARAREEPGAQPRWF